MAETWTPRKRVLAALDHKEPDMVPLDLGGTNCTTLTRQAYHNLRAYLGMPPDPDVETADRLMDAVYPREDLYRRYQIDFRPLHLGAPDGFTPQEMPDGSFYDEFGVHWLRPFYYYDAVERPLAAATGADDLARYPWPDPYDPGRVRGLREEAKRLYEQTDYALVADLMCPGPFEGGCTLRGYDQFLADLYLDPPFAEALLDRFTDLAIGFWDAFLGAVGDYVQVIGQGDDIGIQRGLYISPEMYRRLVKPRHQRLFGFIHSKTRARIHMHTCGSVVEVIPDLIEAGVDILSPVQRSAANMDLARLKADFGRDICFWGGAIDIQQVLPFATLEEIEAEVRRTMEIMAPGGGYVFFPTHNIQPDVTPDRIDRLYQAALRYRGGRLGS